MVTRELANGAILWKDIERRIQNKVWATADFVDPLPCGRRSTNLVNVKVLTIYFVRTFTSLLGRSQASYFAKAMSPFLFQHGAEADQGLSPYLP
jgi:hypothetical protein